MRHLVAIVVVLSMGSPDARAERVKLVAGGPRDDLARADLLAAVDDLAAAMQVCFRNPKITGARVKIEVQRDGSVKRATGAGGVAAQCVAGILGVQRLPAPSRYRATIYVPAQRVRVPAAKMRAIRGKLNQCFRAAAARNKNLRGTVTFRFFVEPSGGFRYPKVESSTLGSRDAEMCMIETLAKGRLDQPVAAKKGAWFTMPIRFDGVRGGGGKPAPASMTGTLQPKKDGPVSGPTISKVMNRFRVAFTACYDRVARRNKKLAGNVTLRFTIKGDGRVRNVKVRASTIKNAAVESCVVAVGKKLTFPAEKGRKDTRVFYPFSFSPR